MISESVLKTEYETNKKPIRQIATENKVSVGTVHNYLKKYGIPRRAKITEETKAKISESKKGRPSPLKGRSRSEETRAKISLSKKGKTSIVSEYGGHEKKHASGYTYVFAPDHPRATKDGYVFKHILAYEKYHDCIVNRDIFCVHHIDGNKENNEKDNLLLMTKSEHMRYHATHRKRGNKK